MLDGQRLRALSHPLRVQLLGLLRRSGPSTATRLGALTDHSSGLTSYHLRKLEAAGLVVDAEREGAGRERWWQSAHRFTRLESGADPERSEQFQHAIVNIYARRADTYLAEMRAWEPTWRKAANLSDWTMRLTAAETERLNADLTELIERYRREGTGTQRVALQIQLFPENGSPA